MPDELEVGPGEQVGDVAFRAGKEIIECDDLMPIRQEPIAQVTPEKARSTGYQYTHVNFLFCTRGHPTAFAPSYEPQASACAVLETRDVPKNS
jgi:hypothetical protein